MRFMLSIEEGKSILVDIDATSSYNPNMGQYVLEMIAFLANEKTIFAYVCFCDYGACRSSAWQLQTSRE